MMTQFQNKQEEAQVELEQPVEKPVVQSTIGFVTDDSNQSAGIPQDSNHSTEANREPLKHLLTGSTKAVVRTIHHLQILGYASVGDWSPLVPSPTNPGEVMSILVRPIIV